MKMQEIGNKNKKWQENDQNARWQTEINKNAITQENIKQNENTGKSTKIKQK